SFSRDWSSDVCSSDLFCGVDGGKFLTANHIAERLEREAVSDVALHVEKLEDGGYRVAGRGVLHLSVIIEKMRREGYEFTVGRPQIGRASCRGGEWASE